MDGDAQQVTASGTGTDVAIDVRSLRKVYGTVEAVKDVSFQVARGECVAILGPNGAGKTTTLEILEGLNSPTSGEVRVLGRSWRTHAAEIRARMGVQLQETNLYERLTVEETVRLFRSFYRRGLDVHVVMQLLQLEAKRHAKLLELSGGQRQRVAVAVALVGDPELLFLDEPTAALDPHSRRVLWDVVDNLRAQGRTLVLTTHYMEEAERLCNRVLILDGGRLIASGSPAELIAQIRCGHVIELHSEPLLPEAEVLALPGVTDVRPLGSRLRISVVDAAETLPRVMGLAAARGLAVREVTTHRVTLEDVFLTLTGHRLVEEAPSEGEPT